MVGDEGKSEGRYMDLDYPHFNIPRPHPVPLLTLMSNMEQKRQIYVVLIVVGNEAILSLG